MNENVGSMEAEGRSEERFSPPAFMHIPQVVRLVHRVLLLLSHPHPLSLGCGLLPHPTRSAFRLSLVMVARFHLSGSSNTSVAWKIPLSSFHPSKRFIDSCQVLPSSLEPIPNCRLAFPARERAAGRSSRPQAAEQLPVSSAHSTGVIITGFFLAESLGGSFAPLTLVLPCDSFYHAVTQPEGPH